MHLARYALDVLGTARFASFEGEILAIGQTFVESRGPLCRVGDFCTIGSDRKEMVRAQVVAVDREKVRMIPLGPVQGMTLDAPVRLLNQGITLPVGDSFAGRAIDAFGEPIDGGRRITVKPQDRIQRAPAKLDKIVGSQRLRTGVRAIDGFLPLAEGQRIGIFAAAGVGKTSLIEDMAFAIECDHLVVCLVGERGREVERFWRLGQGSPAASRLTLLAATSDESAAARVRVMDQALELAEYWRALGRRVVLVVDSATRLAMALREIGTIAGELPTQRSYTSNVFSALPRYVERCGADRTGGSITAIFTVLAETDDVDDAIVETMKSLLDGHIVLARALAEKSHFPAIEIGESVSRVARDVLPAQARHASDTLRAAYSEFEVARPLIESGIYRAGSNPAIDRAIRIRPLLDSFLRQEDGPSASLEEVDRAMAQILEQVR